MPSPRESVPRFHTVCRKWHRRASLNLRMNAAGGCHLRFQGHIVTVMTALTCGSPILDGSAVAGLVAA
jgi:hypothetical protein